MPCTYCGEQIAEDTTVCPHCGAFDPLSDAPAEVSLEPVQTGAEQDREGFIRGLLKDLGCQVVLGCGGILGVGVIAALVAVIAAFCGGGGGDFGYDPDTQEINCQEYLDSDVDASVGLLWGDDEVEVFSIRAASERDHIDWGKQVCPGIAETSNGMYEIWYFVTSEGADEWTLDYEMRPLSSRQTPEP